MINNFYWQFRDVEPLNALSTEETSACPRLTVDRECFLQLNDEVEAVSPSTQLGIHSKLHRFTAKNANNELDVSVRSIERL